ncbi:MAG: hypothetical protein ACTHXA_07360 [Gulosibacter sp.]|uniref:hypothetical protein n=1 Tax=Gulosibacter sp. TaxID=2817531 RepID=UPI003F8E4AC5
MAKRRDSREPGTQVVAWEFRTPARQTGFAIVGVTFLAWVASFFLFTYGSDLGRQQLEASSFLSLFFSWLFVAALVCLGYGIGYAILRSLSQGQRPYEEREVLRLALAESLASTCGGYAIGFVPMILMENLFAMLAWTFFLGLFFSFAVIMPRYSAGWKKAVEEGRHFAG